MEDIGHVDVQWRHGEETSSLRKDGMVYILFGASCDETRNRTGDGRKDGGRLKHRKTRTNEEPKNWQQMIRKSGEEWVLAGSRRRGRWGIGRMRGMEGWMGWDILVMQTGI